MHIPLVYEHLFYKYFVRWLQKARELRYLWMLSSLFTSFCQFICCVKNCPTINEDNSSMIRNDIMSIAFLYSYFEMLVGINQAMFVFPFMDVIIFVIYEITRMTTFIKTKFKISKVCFNLKCKNCHD